MRHVDAGTIVSGAACTHAADCIMIETLREVVSRVAAARDTSSALHHAVDGVKSALQAEACAVYLVDPESGDLVLAETDGLDRASIGQVRLAPGVGVIGLVREQQEALRCDNVSEHPRFHLFAVTGEDRFRAFIGVPMIHRGEIVGVLAIWRSGNRQFDRRDEAFLTTAATQLSGALASTIQVPGDYSAQGSNTPRAATFQQGIAGAPGVAVGQVVLPSPYADLDAVPDRPAVDTAMEETAFLDAVASVQTEILSSGERMRDMLPSESHALFEVYAMLAGGESLSARVVEQIRSGNWAPGALRSAIDEVASEFQAIDDERLKARSEDIRAVGRRLLLALHADQLPPKSFPDRTILVGDEVSLARISEVPRDRLAGIVCLRGSLLSHTVVVARALGIPAVMGLEDVGPERLDGRRVVVDGYMGRLFIDPTSTIVEEYHRLEAEEQQQLTELESLRDVPAVTPDGKRIGLHANTAMLADIDLGMKSGCEGVGLYRSEFPFMLRESFPTEDDQFETYRQMLEAFSPRPVVMRTLDIGGDKPLPYFPIEQTNSLLGWRGIRVTLQHPELLLVQLKAMLRANTGLGNLRLLLPMVSNAGEVRQARAILDQALSRLAGEGVSVVPPPLGAMIEIPVVLFDLDALANEVDFFSIGSNDLTQYLIAADRGNPHVAHLYDDLSPSVLRALKLAVSEAERLGKPISLCGELAADPTGAVLLIGMGIEQISMTPSMLPRIKRTLRSMSYAKSAEVFRRALELPDGKAVRAMINETFEAEGLGGLIRAGR